MLRITLMDRTAKAAVLKIEGWVSGQDVQLLAEEGTRLLGESHRLVLDLSGVQSIDRMGIAQLRQWAGDRLALRGAEPFIRALLESEGLGLACDEL